nr:DUF4405 domain-containing protein [uncultured Trichococcus sp.]
MKPINIKKLTIDSAMTIGLLLLMAYELVGQSVHEWIGVGMFVLFIWHHIFNINWSKNLFRGKYNAYRLTQTAIVSAMLLCLVGLMVSGIMLSRHVFSFLPISGGRQLARIIHLLCSYWGFVLMSLHLGFHWNRVMGMARKRTKKESSVSVNLLRCLAALIVGYGVYAFIVREIGTYILLQSQFVRAADTVFLGLRCDYGIVHLYRALYRGAVENQQKKVKKLRSSHLFCIFIQRFQRTNL